ncbi:hypothetical protein THASP1DRAFT_29883 [Thamnocephalis sphaerospora]|uniref:Uncharacterized protein n=1 Tax=Thamnocephalis sphaerospora TaxID=78915 RepID=A0A4V1IWP8_9FUNG|nr:hypothetical protein THASP1DRAFT_29883 [Thamnocephalis sphaerospora]|eukprot:RKP08309.1 hypothetical protein THASP1DRAFT_29883 [Thamnocephalis sphaerospora]
MTSHSLFEYVDRDTLLEPGWEKNATYLWGTPIRPLGELGTIDYVLQAQDNLQDMRMRARGVFIQTATICVVGYVFLRNCIISVQITRRRPYVLSHWCCVVQAASGIGYTICAILLIVPGGLSCRQALWYACTTISLSSLCVSVTLLQRAYLAHGRSRRLLVLGISFILPQPIAAYIMWTSPISMAPSIGCILLYPYYFPWVKFALDAPINILLSVAFIMVVHKQYQRFGSAAWAQLVRNGTQTMCAIVLANFICMFSVAFEVFGLFSEMFLAFDWIIASTLLVRYCDSRKALSTESTFLSNSRKTGKISLLITETDLEHAHTSAAMTLKRYHGGRYTIIQE